MIKLVCFFRACCLGLLIVALTQGAVAGEQSVEYAEIEQRALQYFIDHAHPTTGLVRDSANNFTVTPATNHVASIAATGFGITALANAAARGLLPRSTVYQLIVKTLRFVRDKVPRYRGWFLHFIDWQTGARVWSSEFSTIDTAILLSGAIYAGAVFPRSEIAEIADQIYRDVNFLDMLTDGGAKVWKKTLSLSFTYEQGYAPYQWEVYSEQMMLLLLGLGHPEKPLPQQVWYSWQRQSQLLPNGERLIGYDMPLFIHQYSHLWFDFRKITDGYQNYFRNSQIANRENRAIAKNDQRVATFREGYWGLSAGDGPDGYLVNSPIKYTSTVCIGCAVGSAMLAPQVVLADLTSWLVKPNRTEVFGKYGFVDGIDVDRKWTGRKVLGITVGAAYLSVANLNDSTSIWQDFMKIPAVQTGLRRAGFSTE